MGIIKGGREEMREQGRREGERQEGKKEGGRERRQAVPLHLSLYHFLKLALN